MRTGGGYTYFRRNKPVEPMTERSQLNWRSTHDSPAYIHYDGKYIVCFSKYRYKLEKKTVRSMSERSPLN